ncbi:MAG: hypothetical protein R2861_16625 [Desulfobacterales bacterium]
MRGFAGLLSGLQCIFGIWACSSHHRHCGGKIAAVDMGAVFNNTYTVVGGAPHGFVGIAKVINLHHLNGPATTGWKPWIFLCGGFNWKERFRLSPRPSYEIHTQPDTAVFMGAIMLEKQSELKKNQSAGGGHHI